MGEEIGPVVQGQTLRIVIDMVGPVHTDVAKLFKKDLGLLLDKYRGAMGSLKQPVKRGAKKPK